MVLSTRLNHGFRRQKLDRGRLRFLPVAGGVTRITRVSLRRGTPGGRSCQGIPQQNG